MQLAACLIVLSLWALATRSSYASPLQLVKRQTVPLNPDGQLKQISLQSLIGDLESSLYSSALSVSGVGHDGDLTVPEVTPAPPSASSTGHSTITKRHTEPLEPVAAVRAAGAAAAPSDATTESLTVAGNKVLLQTTSQVPPIGAVPAHILIDRISVQPHYGGVPLIPAFEVHHSKLVTAAVQPATATKTTTTITKTDITATGTLAPAATHADSKAASSVATSEQPSSTSPASVELQLERSSTPKSHDEVAAEPSSSTASSTTASTTSSSSTHTSTTTPKSTSQAPIKALKEAEEELKEKVAEIEAEPIILSARV